MKRVRWSMIGGAIALIGVAAANADPASAPVSDTTVRVESAGADGGELTHTADVHSAEYDALPAQHLPTPSLPLLGALAAGAVAIGLFFSLRRRPGTPPV